MAGWSSTTHLRLQEATKCSLLLNILAAHGHGYTQNHDHNHEEDADHPCSDQRGSEEAKGGETGQRTTVSQKRRQALKISKNKQISVTCISFTDCRSAEAMVSYSR